MREWKRKKFYGIYTLLACLLFLWIFLIHLSTGKSSIWENDAIKQHYISLAYYGNYLRDILKNIFIHHTFELPMWDMHIGYGADVITTLHYYVYGDPLNLLSVFVPENKTEYLYEALIFLRMYLAGITFSRFCFFHKHKEYPVLIGTMIYISSMWMITVGFNHIFFLIPSVYFPLVLLGIDKIYGGKRPFTYIGALALSALANFYFFYMIGIFTVLYGILRYFMLYRKLYWKKIGMYLGKFCLYSILGIGIAGGILLPVVMSTLRTERFGVSYFIPVLFSKEYYKELPVILTSSSGERYTLIGVAGVCALSLFIMFMKRKKYTGLKACVILLCIFYCIPFAGHVLNGFSYVSNRWSWAAVMFFAYLFVKIYPEFFCLTAREKKMLLIAAVLYGGYIFWFPRTRNVGGILAGIALIVTSLLLFVIKKKQVLPLILAGSVTVSAAANICYSFKLKDGVWNRPLQNLDIGEADEMVHTDVYDAMKQKPEIDIHRYEQNTSTIYNTAMLNDLNSGQFYFSIAQQGINRFFEKNYVSTLMEQVILGLNNRAWLMKLFGMKYCIEDGDRIPFGYEPTQPAAIYGKSTQIYEDTNPMAMAYTYDSYISEENYENMKGEQRQEAMLQGVVLEDSKLSLCTPEYSSTEVGYEIEKTKGVEILEDKFVVSRRNARCLLKINGLKKCETYVSFDGLEYEGYDIEKSKIFEVSHIDSANIICETYDENKNGKQSIYLRSYKNNFQDNRENYMSNLGYFDDDIKEIKLTFTEPGVYSFKNMRVVCQKMDTLDKWVDERNQDKIQNLSMEGNHLTCNLSLDQEKALVFSVPYSDGWKATVDGEPAELKKANIMFMAVELPAGDHEIKLEYTTPYVRTGLFCTLLSISITIILFFKRKHYFI